MVDFRATTDDEMFNAFIAADVARRALTQGAKAAEKLEKKQSVESAKEHLKRAARKLHKASEHYEFAYRILEDDGE